MRAGKLNQRVSIQARDAGQDAAGQPVRTWSQIANGAVWANILHKKGVEAIQADKPTSTVQASIRLRWRTDLDAGMRIVHGSTTYEVKAVLPDEHGREHIDAACEVVHGHV